MWGPTLQMVEDSRCFLLWSLECSTWGILYWVKPLWKNLHASWAVTLATWVKSILSMCIHLQLELQFPAVPPSLFDCVDPKRNTALGFWSGWFWAGVSFFLPSALEQHPKTLHPAVELQLAGLMFNRSIDSMGSFTNPKSTFCSSATGVGISGSLGICWTHHQTSHICWRWNIPSIVRWCDSHWDINPNPWCLRLTMISWLDWGHPGWILQPTNHEKNMKTQHSERPSVEALNSCN